MKRARSIAGYAWAVACVVAVLATFIGNDYFSARLASATGVTISPRYSGGEIVRSIDHGAYRTVIRRPVFDGLIGERKEGFIQIEWQPVTALPPVIEDEIDFTGDGKEDFAFRLDTAAGKGALTPRNPSVIAVETLVKVNQGWVARIRLRKVS
ncbi:MAG: hypothetical protein KKH02_12285 [Proteobacteria bacterium]|nr:hypothetical protein [Pseudomonadota bacterium]MBU1745145.1 hypothetical protein [Pseudomonadota bacterium]MBU4583168.1 hypothetical protein [Pseudomonadota bacterium]MCG2741939.1 hypothetical protein [Syntrophaceae bacterium]